MEIVAYELALLQPLSATLMLTFSPGLFCDGCGALALNTSLALTNMRPILSLIFGGRDKLTGPQWTRLLQGLLLEVAMLPASRPTARYHQGFLTMPMPLHACILTLQRSGCMDLRWA